MKMAVVVKNEDEVWRNIDEEESMWRSINENDEDIVMKV